MTGDTRAQCINRLLCGISDADRDAEYLHSCGEHLKAEQKRAEGLALRRALARFTAPRPMLAGVAASAPGSAPVPSRVPPGTGRYRSIFSVLEFLR